MAGGAVLPSFMGNIAGGTITLNENLTGNMSVTHNLNELPKGIVVYRLTGDVTNASSEKMLIAGFYVENATGSTGDWCMNSIYLASGNGAKATAGIQNNDTVGIRKVTSTTFTITGKAAIPFKAGETYYWIAWTHS